MFLHFVFADFKTKTCHQSELVHLMQVKTLNIGLGIVVKKAKISNMSNLIPPICLSACGEQHDMSILTLLNIHVLSAACLASEILAHS